MRLFLVALQFLTRLPVRLERFEPAWLNDCVRHFPLVGTLVGGAGAAVLWGAAQVWPAWVAALLALAATVALTGGFHEDGLADTFDALGGVVSRDRALAIMKDSRIGSYGAIALALVFFLKIGLIAALAQADAFGTAWALFAAHAFSRLMPVGVAAILPNIRDAQASKSKAITAGVGWRVICGAVFWALLALAAAAWQRPGLIWLGGAAACVLAWLLMCRLLRRRLQGYTGDALGATQQVCELAFYLGLLFCLPTGAAT